MSDLYPNDPIGPLAPDTDTLPKNLLKTVQQVGPNRVAMRKKRFGIWQEYTWADCLEHVKTFSLGLVSLGLKKGDKVCIVGDNDPEYYWAELASHAVGGVTIGVFTDATPRELEYLITNSDAVFVIAQDQEQCDKMLEIREKVPNVRQVVYWDEKSLWGYEDETWLVGFSAVQALGREYAQQHPNHFEELVNQGTGDDLAILSYTSGTTSLPKGAMITQSNLIYGSRHAAQVARVTPADDYVSFSPLAWITEQALGLAYHVMDGMVVNFPEKAETVQNDIREISPAMLLFPSRLWESLVSQVQANMTDSDHLNRFFYRVFLQIGYKLADYQEKGQDPPPQWKFLKFIGELALFAPLRDKLGLSRLRYGYTSGASLSPDVLRFFRAIQVELYQLYGSTECQGHTFHYPGDVYYGTVGKPIPTVNVRIADDSEIQIKSRSMFQGYYKDTVKTQEAFTEDGWFKTGDAGRFEEHGHLVYLDRVKDMIRLPNGAAFSPQYIEGRLKFSPYVQDVMVIGGDDMAFVAALLTLNFDNAARWAEKRGISFTTLADLSQRPEVGNLILEDVHRTNATLDKDGQIQRFVILPRTFDPDEEELTRTRKLRRGAMEKKYGDILTAIYTQQTTLTMRAEVRYRDGRVGYTETDVQIRDV